MTNWSGTVRVPPSRWLGAARVLAIAVVASAVAFPSPAIAAVEEGLYFDPTTAVVGQQQTVFSDEAPFCPDAFYLAPGSVQPSSRNDSRLLHVTGTFISQEVAEFRFTVPDVANGTYRGWVFCKSYGLNSTANELHITGGTPATDTAAPTARGAGSRLPVGVVVLFGAAGALLMLRRGRQETNTPSTDRPTGHARN